MQDISDWYYQFALANKLSDSFADWDVQRLSNWQLATHNTLPLVDVVDEYQNNVGLLLGWPIQNSTLQQGLESPIRLDLGLDEQYNLSGRWLLIDFVRQRVYLDSCGSQAAVFNSKDKILASTPLLASGCGSTSVIAGHYNIPESDRFYGFGLTGIEGVSRLLPNHYLDLSTWRPVRHHPGLIETVNTTNCAKILIQDVQSTARAITNRWPIILGLTAGKDSRMLLGALRSSTNQVRTFTRWGFGRQVPLEIAVAIELAQREQIRHHVVERIDATNAELNSWQLRTGSCVAGATWLCAAMDESHDLDCCMTLGLAGECARGYYWRGVCVDETITAEIICKLTKQPLQPVVLAAASEWLENLPQSLTVLDLLDLLYLECRVGAWASPQLYGARRPIPSIMLLAKRSTIDAMLGLSQQDKKTGSLAMQVLRLNWPELAKVPFNKPLGMPLVKYIYKQVISTLIRRLRIFERS